MNLRDMAPRKRFEVVRIALDFTLQDITQPEPTWEIAKRVSRRLDYPDTGYVSRMLVRVAPDYPEARQGERFERFGRGMRRWIWSPRRATATVSDEGW